MQCDPFQAKLKKLGFRVSLRVRVGVRGFTWPARFVGEKENGFVVDVNALGFLRFILSLFPNICFYMVKVIVH